MSVSPGSSRLEHSQPIYNPFVSLTKLHFSEAYANGRWSIPNMPSNMRRLATKRRPSDVFGEVAAEKRKRLDGSDQRRPLIARSELGHERQKQKTQQLMTSITQSNRKNDVLEHIRIRLHRPDKLGQYSAQSLKLTSNVGRSSTSQNHGYRVLDNDDTSSPLQMQEDANDDLLVGKNDAAKMPKSTSSTSSSCIDDEVNVGRVAGSDFENKSSYECISGLSDHHPRVKQNIFEQFSATKHERVGCDELVANCEIKDQLDHVTEHVTESSGKRKNLPEPLSKSSPSVTAAVSEQDSAVLELECSSAPLHPNRLAPETSPAREVISLIDQTVTEANISPRNEPLKPAAAAANVTSDCVSSSPAMQTRHRKSATNGNDSSAGSRKRSNRFFRNRSQRRERQVYRGQVGDEDVYVFEKVNVDEYPSSVSTTVIGNRSSQSKPKNMGILRFKNIKVCDSSLGGRVQSRRAYRTKITKSTGFSGGKNTSDISTKTDRSCSNEVLSSPDNVGHITTNAVIIPVDNQSATLEESSVEGLLLLTTQLNSAFSNRGDAEGSDGLTSVTKYQRKTDRNTGPTSIKAPSAAAAVQVDILARELGPRFNWLENKINNSMNSTNVVKTISELPPVVMTTKIPDNYKIVGASTRIETIRCEDLKRDDDKDLGYVDILARTSGNDAAVQAAEAILSLSSRHPQQHQQQHTTPEYCRAISSVSFTQSINVQPNTRNVFVTPTKAMEYFYAKDQRVTLDDNDCSVDAGTRGPPLVSHQLSPTSSPQLHKKHDDDADQYEDRLIVDERDALNDENYTSDLCEETLKIDMHRSPPNEEPVSAAHADNNSREDNYGNNSEEKSPKPCLTALESCSKSPNKSIDSTASAAVDYSLQNRRNVVAYTGHKRDALRHFYATSFGNQDRAVLEAKRDELYQELGRINNVLSRSADDDKSRDSVAAAADSDHVSARATLFPVNKQPAHSRQASVKILVRSANPPLAHLTKFDLTTYTYMHCCYDHKLSLEHENETIREATQRNNKTGDCGETHSAELKSPIDASSQPQRPSALTAGTVAKQQLPIPHRSAVTNPPLAKNVLVSESMRFNQITVNSQGNTGDLAPVQSEPLLGSSTSVTSVVDDTRGKVAAALHRHINRNLPVSVSELVPSQLAATALVRPIRPYHGSSSNLRRDDVPETTLKPAKAVLPLCVRGSDRSKETATSTSSLTGNTWNSTIIATSSDRRNVQSTGYGAPGPLDNLHAFVDGQPNKPNSTMIQFPDHQHPQTAQTVGLPVPQTVFHPPSLPVPTQPLEHYGVRPPPRYPGVVVVSEDQSTLRDVRPTMTSYDRMNGLDTGNSQLIPTFGAQSFHPKRLVRPTNHHEVPIQTSSVNSTDWQPLQQQVIGDVTGGALGQLVLNFAPLPIQRTINKNEQDYTCMTCGKPASFVCSACKHAPYCSPECQAISWRQGHSASCCVSST